jgi:hypothetical protein
MDRSTWRAPLVVAVIAIGVLGACSSDRSDSTGSTRSTGRSATTDSDGPTGSTASTGSSGAPTNGPAAAMPAPGEHLTCPDPTVTVSDADGLTKALATAAPGDVIRLAAGTYAGRFISKAEATADHPIFVCGPRDAVIDAGGVRGGYAWHLDGATGWRLLGFTVRDAQKGVVVDRGVDDIVEGLLVEQIGDEAIHLRTFSTDDIVRGNEIHDTGQRRDKFGEGVYVGSAKSNWCTYSGCDPDRSDRNLIEGNTISATTAESVDLKEGSANGVVRDNTFDGSALTGADSWVDAKGNDWLIEGNVGTNSPMDGFQMHHILDGWGTGNVFRDNTATVNGKGHGFAVTNTSGNVISCDNRVAGATAGFADVDCTP